MAMLEEQGYARKVKELGWVVGAIRMLNSQAGEIIGLFELLAHDREKGRVLTSIQINFQTFLNGNLKDFLPFTFESAHYSRADVACDIFNVTQTII